MHGEHSQFQVKMLNKYSFLREREPAPASAEISFEIHANCVDISACNVFCCWNYL